MTPMNPSEPVLHAPAGSLVGRVVHGRCPRWGEDIFLPSDAHGGTLHLCTVDCSAPFAPGAGLLIVHGMNEYIGRYGAIAQYFARRFTVCGVDLCAHGLTNPALFEADRAIAAGAPAYPVADAFLAQAQLRTLDPVRSDVDRALRHLATRLEGRTGAGAKRPAPVFILCHSLGTLAAASYLLGPYGANDPRRRVAGIIFCGPAFSVPELPVPGLRGILQNSLVRFSFWAHDRATRPWPGLSPAHMGEHAAASVAAWLIDALFRLLSVPALRRRLSPITPDWIGDLLTDWTEERTRYRSDEYIIRRTQLTFVNAVEREIVAFRHRMAGFHTPYLLIYSGQDPITPAWGPLDFATATRRHHPDNRIVALEDKYHHEHLFSAPPLRETVLRLIDAWLVRRLAGESP